MRSYPLIGKTFVSMKMHDFKRQSMVSFPQQLWYAEPV